MSYGVVSRKSLIVIIILCVLLASSLLYQFVTPVMRVEKERPIVGIIRVEGTIIEASDARRITSSINNALLNGSVKAVVLMIDSPGGYAHLIEQIYLDILELKREKPIVAAAVTALSGGYYIAVAADYIYAHPTSMVGNVGVIGTAPPVLIPSERVIETGPQKWTGFSRILFPFNLTHALESFLSAVLKGRGDRLKVSSNTIRRGLVYLGSEAREAGLIDEIGSLQAAIEHAARLANLTEYRVEEIQPSLNTTKTLSSMANKTSIMDEALTLEALNRIYPPPAVYYLYLPLRGGTRSPLLLSPEEEPRLNVSSRAEGANVVVDLSHGNMISAWELDMLAAELSKRNITLGFASKWEDVDSSLENASALIIAAPTLDYSRKEVDRISKFVGEGRILLLFSDPSSEFLSPSSLLGPINSVANRFGLSFAKGYLYNEEDHYGFYRNIILRDFTNSSLTSGLGRVVLFTSTHIYSDGMGVATAPGGTYSSTAERPGVYAPIAVAERNGTVAAFGDITFLMEPYCYVEDNYRLILNIVSAISRVEVRPPERVEEERMVKRPELPVGTEKVYREVVDGEERMVMWVKVSEGIIRVERPDRNTTYYLDDEGSLLRWESDGMEASYDEPIPEEPYPLTEGERWTYGSPYNITIQGRTYRGRLSGEGEVEGFRTIEAGDGKSYFTAEVKLKERDEIMMEETNMTIISEGTLWISSEAGLVKGEYTTKYYVEGMLTGEETRMQILISIKKGGQ
ncbi:MAG: S49 family peptidase [Candidatus Bathyarchaeia archaeon]|nr:S49 family peptidase [Candidatus Bathyarchaeota archaeon]